MPAVSPPNPASEPQSGDDDAFIPAHKPRARIITRKEGIDTPTPAQTTAWLSGKLKGPTIRKHLSSVNATWGGSPTDDTFTALTPINYFLHITRKSYNLPQLFLDTVSSASEHPDVCVHIDHLYNLLSGYPMEIWPRFLYVLDIASNGTGDTATLRKLMGKPGFPSLFNAHQTTLLTTAFNAAATYAKEGVYRMCKRIPNMYDGINRPQEYHAAKAAFIDQHTPTFMAAINTHYKDKWTVSLSQAAKILITMYHTACNHKEPDSSIAHWLALHVPTIHCDHHAPPLIPLL